MKAISLLNLLRNKYLLTFLGFCIWLILFDQHNLVDRVKTKRYLNKIIQDTAYYHNQIIKDREVINQLQTDKENLEKFAREKYLMKEADEDIYIIKKK